MREAQPHRESEQQPAHRHRSRQWLVVGFGLAVVCVSGTALASVPPTDPPATEPAPTEPAAESTTAPTTTTGVPPTTTAPESTTTTTTVAPAPAPAPVDIDLVPLCTSSEDMAAGTRTFRLDNHGTEPVEVTLRNVATGGSVSGTAAPGRSTWEVPAGDGSNTTEVVANGQVVATTDSTNLMCGALHGHAECNPSNGTTTITWTVSNNDGSAAIVLSDSRGVDFQPNPDAPHGESTGVEVVDGPASDEQITETVTIQLADGGTSQLSASVTAAACTGPSLTPDVSFTFTKAPSVPTAGLGDTVGYVYCGQNTGALALEVVRLVDDRLGVVIEVPGVETVVAPGDSLCNTDIGQPVNYTVRPADVGTTITNHAVVTVRTVEATPRVLQATATATVDVALSPAVLGLLSGMEKTWICHRTEAGEVNPYNRINVSGSSVEEEGHLNHPEDIIPPGPWGPGQRYDPANGAIWLNDCRNLEALPLAPTLIQATCQGGVVIPPSVVPADKPLGVTYTIAPTSPGDGSADITVTVTATLTLGYDWGSPLPAGWTPVDARTATWTGTLKGTSCAAVAPVLPTLTEAACIRGELQPPSLTVAETTNVTYTTNPTSGYAPGGEVTVTATLADGAAWAANIAPWTRTSATTATYTLTFEPAECITATPEEPAVVAARCTGGVVVPPVISPRRTDGVLYALIPSDPGDGTTDRVITVTATLLDGYAWEEPLPEGWTAVGDTTVARFELTLTGARCRPVTPEAPDVEQAVCADGVLSAPSLELAVTADVTYAVDPEGPYRAGQKVIVTATLAASGIGWGDERPAGWTFVDAQTATLAVTFDDIGCTPATPGDPGVVQATCTGGVVVPPEVTLSTTAGITYTMDPTVLGDGTAPLTVTVTARLADGYEWGQLDADWTRVDATTATWRVELSGASCDAVTPAAPKLTQAVCANGVLSAPTLELATTDDVTYTVNPDAPYVAGQTVTVTATLAASAVAWGDTRPAGWTFVDAQTATLDVTFDDVACTLVIPEDPGVVQATCTGGVVVPPEVTLPTTPGITYTMDPTVLGDGTAPLTVTVTARLADGYEWGQLDADWTRVDATTATWRVELSGASCDAVTPAAPKLTQAVCANGVLSAPTLELATTDDVTYTVDPDAPYVAGQTVTVTATLAASAVAWGDTRPAGWTFVDAQTATLDVTFDDVACTLVIPEDPIVLPPGQSPDATVELPATPGVIYAVDSASSETAPVVSATLRHGYTWGPLPDHWRQDNATTARFGLASPTPTTTPADLAHTGAATLVLQSVLAASMLVVGFLLCLLGRRRAVR